MFCRCPLVLTALALGVAVRAQGLVPGNVLVSTTENDKGYVWQFTREGKFVTRLNVPRLPGQAITEHNRDVAIDDRGRLHVFNGTFQPYLSTFDPVAGSRSHWDYPGWSIQNNLTFGKLATYKQYVFANDSTFASEPSGGILRFDQATHTVTKFASQARWEDDYLDLTLGNDGLLYAMSGVGPLTGTSISVYDPETLQLIRTIAFPIAFVNGEGHNTRSVAVDAGGNIYLNALYGPIFKFSPSFQRLATNPYSTTTYCNDLNIDEKGQLMVTRYDGKVILFDPNLQNMRTVENAGIYGTFAFGGFVPVPEPASLALLAPLAVWTMLRGPRRNGRRRG